MTQQATSQMLEPRRGLRMIDSRAWACLERCRAKLCLAQIPLPVPVEEWIEGPLEISFGFSDLSHLGESVLGAAYVQEREILIDERVTSHEGRFRFTCAHELGHITLHRKVRSVFHETEALGMHLSTGRYEREADRFAAAFLMPIPLLEREVLAVCDANGLSRADAIITLMKPTIESEWLWRKCVLPAVTRRFNVSLSAVVIRFGDIQPKIQDSLPLLPTAFSRQLLRPTRDRQEIDSVWIENGIPISRNLFDRAADTHRAAQ